MAVRLALAKLGAGSAGAEDGDATGMPVYGTRVTINTGEQAQYCVGSLAVSTCRGIGTYQFRRSHFALPHQVTMSTWFMDPTAQYVAHRRVRCLPAVCAVVVYAESGKRMAKMERKQRGRGGRATPEGGGGCNWCWCFNNAGGVVVVACYSVLSSAYRVTLYSLLRRACKLFGEYLLQMDRTKLQACICRLCGWFPRHRSVSHCQHVTIPWGFTASWLCLHRTYILCLLVYV